MGGVNGLFGWLEAILIGDAEISFVVCVLFELEHGRLFVVGAALIGVDSEMEDDSVLFMISGGAMLLLLVFGRMLLLLLLLLCWFMFFFSLARNAAPVV
jgi:hypothetical protein